MIQPEKIPGIQPGPVTEWLESHIEGVEGPLRFERIKGGHSNLTFKLEDTRGNAWVLRRPPLGTLLATAHDMGREHRIIAALGPTAVPVPPALGLCTDESVNDAPFYIMAWVSGHVLENAATAQALLDTEGRQRLGSDVIQVLSELHTVDVDAVGLGDLGRKENYLARQLKRWTRQWNDSKTRELAVMEEVSSGLAELLPEQIGATIVHGDYRLGNMLATPEGRIAAVLDWELCTLGDPLADVAYVLNNWDEPGEVALMSADGTPPPTAAGGFPSREAFLERYSELSGRSTDLMPYYRAFQHWRSAAIAEGVLDRYLRGKMAGDLDTDHYRVRVEGFANAAREALSGL